MSPSPGTQENPTDDVPLLPPLEAARFLDAPSAMSLGITHYNVQKQVLVEALLPLCPFLLIDASHPDVMVPESLKIPELVLRIGRDPNVMGMPDLVLDETGWRATISLRGVRHYVTVPWEACSRCWVGRPFSGPMVDWPVLKQPEQQPDKPKGGGLRLVKT